MCSVVISDCTYLLKTYKRLDYENRERVRYPLRNSSWPNFGQPWDLFAVELYCAYDNFGILKLKIESLWNTAGRKDRPRILRLTEAARRPEEMRNVSRRFLARAISMPWMDRPGGLSYLILGHGGIYFVAPGQNAALHVAGAEAGLLQ